MAISDGLMEALEERAERRAERLEELYESGFPQRLQAQQQAQAMEEQLARQQQASAFPEIKWEWLLYGGLAIAGLIMLPRILELLTAVWRTKR